VASWRTNNGISWRELAAMKNLLRMGLSLAALVVVTSAGRAQWGAPPPGPGCGCGYGPAPAYSAGPGVCCSAPCDDCCRRGLLGRIKDRICHSSPCCPTTCCSPPCCSTPCCPTTCCSPCGQCCNACPCEPACRHPILDKLRALRCKCSPRECCSPCGDCCPPRHRLFGFLHRDHGCCTPAEPCCGSCGP
jgi:hypothetical protein